MAQIENGLRTDYVQDVAAALPQVLMAQQGGTVSKYLRGLGLIGEQSGGTGPNAAPATWQYHLPDALGSVRQIADPTGQLLLTQRFDPFGGLLQRSSVGGPRSAYGFAGEEQDPTSGQLFLRARTYNPSTGRFLQSDPVMGSPADPRTLHHYAYAFNNPVNYTDPSGLMPYTLQRPQQHQNSALQKLISSYNNYSIDAATQVGYMGGARRGGFNRAYLGQASQASGIGSQRAATGLEGQNWHRFSDPQPKQQSQGHRSKVCSFTDLLFGFGNSALSGNLLKDVFEFATHIPTLARPIMPLLQNISKMMLSGQLGQGGLILSPTGLFAGDGVFAEWFKGQLEDIKLAWDQRDWKMAASLSFGFGTSLVVMGLASSRVGTPVAILAGAASVVLNTTFNAWLYDDWGNFWANLAGSSVEMAFSLAGGLIGGPQGWIVGNVIGSAAGQITTNVLSGQQWDRGLLAAMLFSVVSEGVGGAIGHGLGKWLGGGLDVNGVPPRRFGSAEYDGVNTRRSVDAEMASASSDDGPNLFQRFSTISDEDLNRYIVKQLRKTVKKAPDREVGRIAKELADKIEQGEVPIHYLDPDEFAIRTREDPFTTSGVFRPNTFQIRMK